MSGKNVFTFILIVFVLGMVGMACISSAAPATQPPPPPPTDDVPGAFETQVAEGVLTLEAEGEINSSAAAQTVAAALTLTSAAGGQPAPVDTQVPPTQPPTQTPPPTPTETLVPTVTPTNTSVPSPTFVPGDPGLALGDPDFRDEFNNETNWSPYDAASSKAEINNGKFYYTKKTLEFGSRWTISWPTIEDYYIEVTAETPATCSGRDRYGIIFRAPSANEGYVFVLSCSGQYRLWIWDGSETTFLVDWTSHAAINAGPGQINRVGVMVDGNTIKLYANGVELTTLTDNTYIGEYKFGLVVGNSDTEPFTVIFDDLKYWLLP
ncbi:MAG: LamG domain-containing protein [Chloroflexi bacterium]|nr:LamG domain-containing protein [Chloroflexota bacterium]